MAFTRENLTIMSNNVKSGVVPAPYFYYNEAGDTVTDAGFFVDTRLNVGDIIQELKADYTVLTFYRVSATTAGAATVLALTTVTP
jgi:hypothetical protein